MREAIDLPTMIGHIARDSLNMPTFGMGGGSATELEAQERWRAELQERWQTAIGIAERGWPEAQRILYTIGAELRFVHPRTGTRLSLDSSTSAIFSVLG